MFSPVKLGWVLLVGLSVYMLGYSSGYKQVKPPIVVKVVKVQTELVPQFYPMDKKALDYVTSIIPEGMYKPFVPKEKKVSSKKILKSTPKPASKPKKKVMLAQD